MTILQIPTLAGAARDGLIADLIIVWLWVLEDNIPGMNEAREEAEQAEGDIDEGVRGADSSFDPH